MKKYVVTLDQLSTCIVPQIRKKKQSLNFLKKQLQIMVFHLVFEQTKEKKIHLFANSWQKLGVMGEEVFLRHHQFITRELNGYGEIFGMLFVVHSITCFKQWKFKVRGNSKSLTWKRWHQISELAHYFCCFPFCTHIFRGKGSYEITTVSLLLHQWSYFWTAADRTFLKFYMGSKR